MYKKNLFVFYIIMLSFNSFAENTKFNITELTKEIKNMQSECPKCNDLNDITCIQNKIHCCVEIDQYIRNKTINYINNEQLNSLFERVDQYNTKELKSILKIYGWLNISRFGKKTDSEAWLLVQHADHDLEFQSSIAFILEQLVKTGETNPRNFAYLYDRVAINFNDIGLKQKYGTQAIIKDGKAELYPFEGTIEDVDKRRKEVGLESVEAYLQQINDFYLK